MEDYLNLKDLDRYLENIERKTVKNRERSFIMYTEEKGASNFDEVLVTHIITERMRETAPSIDGYTSFSSSVRKNVSSILKDGIEPFIKSLEE